MLKRFFAWRRWQAAVKRRTDYVATPIDQWSVRVQIALDRRAERLGLAYAEISA